MTLPPPKLRSVVTDRELLTNPRATKLLPKWIQFTYIAVTALSASFFFGCAVWMARDFFNEHELALVGAAIFYFCLSAVGFTFSVRLWRKI